ncbi:MAG: hypothetical protein ACREOJ_10980, partial [Gemmatimonadaceae bacterium]
LNLPVTSYRDLTIHGNDLIAGTYGRGIWILDDYTVLRQLTPAVAAAPAHLFKPDDAVRVRRNVNYDTPFPPEVPHALNPPDGVVFYYSLSAKPTSDVTMEVLDGAGHVVRHLSSAPVKPLPDAEHPPEPNFWLAAPEPLPTDIGTNRAIWDLRYDAPPAFRYTFEINANPDQTPPSPEGPLASPGVYTLVLTVNGVHYRQTVTVRNDPRSPATASALAAQHALLMKLDAGVRSAWDDYQRVAALRTAVKRAASTGSAVTAAADAFVAKLDSVAGDAENARGFRRRGGPTPPPTFTRMNGEFVQQLEAQDNADMAPTGSMLAAEASACKDLDAARATWTRISTSDLAAFNAILTQNGLSALPAPSRVKPAGC